MNFMTTHFLSMKPRPRTSFYLEYEESPLLLHKTFDIQKKTASPPPLKTDDTEEKKSSPTLLSLDSVSDHISKLNHEESLPPSKKQEQTIVSKQDSQTKFVNEHPPLPLPPIQKKQNYPTYHTEKTTINPFQNNLSNHYELKWNSSFELSKPKKSIKNLEKKIILTDIAHTFTYEIKQQLNIEKLEEMLEKNQNIIEDILEEIFLKSIVITHNHHYERFTFENIKNVCYEALNTLIKKLLPITENSLQQFCTIKKNESQKKIRIKRKLTETILYDNIDRESFKNRLDLKLDQLNTAFFEQITLYEFINRINHISKQIPIDATTIQSIISSLAKTCEISEESLKISIHQTIDPIKERSPYRTPEIEKTIQHSLHTPPPALLPASTNLSEKIKTKLTAPYDVEKKRSQILKKCQQEIFKKEYKENKKNCSIGRLSQNQKFNRFPENAPLNKTLVQLSKNEYHNASLIQSKNLSFISTQAPLTAYTEKDPSTIETHWKMIWEYKSPITVILEDFNTTATLDQKKFHPYFPTQKKDIKSFDNIFIHCKSVTHTSWGTHYKLKIWQSNTIVRHKKNHQILHFKKPWFPEEKDPVPLNQKEFIDFVQTTNATYKNSVIEDGLQGPPVVHCIYGLQRTCMYLLLVDILNRITIDPNTSSNIIEVSLKNILSQRNLLMLPTPNQFNFVLACLKSL